MKIVNILGGLGNQMFQYAFALKLKNLLPKEQIKIYTKAFNGYSLHNGYELNRLFELTFPEANIMDVSKVYWPVANYTTYRICRYFMPPRNGYRDSYVKPVTIEDMKKYSFFDGYFQRASHYVDISEIIIDAFKFPYITDENNKIVTHFLSKGSTASIHIRRGDYLTDKNYGGICSLLYYKNALNILKQRTATTQILVFSNDIEWSKAHLSEDLNGFHLLFVDWNTKENSFRDMQLMSMCDHNIIANSSFSWWGAFLNRNPEKIVIAPNKWAHSYTDTPILPPEWIKVQL